MEDLANWDRKIVNGGVLVCCPQPQAKNSDDD
jgi:hypothetical protein